MFLTRIPVGRFLENPQSGRWSVACFPLVGMAVGAVSALCFSLLYWIGPWVAAFAAFVASVLITGAMHEDGLADSADALGGGFDREAVFRILKDSRIGVFGAIALILSLVGRIATLAIMKDAWVILIVSHSAARLSPVLLMVALPYQTSQESSRSLPFISSGWVQALVAAGTVGCCLAGFAVVGLLSLSSVIAVCLAVIVITVFSGWYYYKRVGGYTGDFLGATEQLSEIIILVVLAAKLPGEVGLSI